MPRTSSNPFFAMPFPDIDWIQAVHDFVKVLIAFLLAMPIAWDREERTRIMGLRTFPLVALASCGYVLVAGSVLGYEAPEQARIIQGLMTGIGFLGGGAILKEGANVRGSATAASIWATGALGGAVAYGRYEIALVISLANFIVLRVLTPTKRLIKDNNPADD